MCAARPALCDEADQTAIALTRAGADEGDILAAMHSVIFAGGGDYPANEFIIGSGQDALLCRYKSGRRVLDVQDQLTLEFAGAFRHYHCAAMRTHIIGQPRPKHVAYHAAAKAALLACEAELKPGRTAGDVLCGACANLRCPWTSLAPAQCLRLFAWRQIHTLLDGPAHDV